MGIHHSVICVSPHRRGPGKIAGCPHLKCPATDSLASDGLYGNCAPRNLWSIPPAYPIYKPFGTIRRQLLHDATVPSHRPDKYVRCLYVKAKNRHPSASQTAKYPDRDRPPCDESPPPSDKFPPALPGEVRIPPNPFSASFPLREQADTHDTAYSYGRPKAGTRPDSERRHTPFGPLSIFYPCTSEFVFRSGRLFPSLLLLFRRKFRLPFRLGRGSCPAFASPCGPFPAAA